MEKVSFVWKEMGPIEPGALFMLLLLDSEWSERAVDLDSPWISCKIQSQTFHQY